MNMPKLKNGFEYTRVTISLPVHAEQWLRETAANECRSVSGLVTALIDAEQKRRAYQPETVAALADQRSA